MLRDYIDMLQSFISDLQQSPIQNNRLLNFMQNELNRVCNIPNVDDEDIISLGDNKYKLHDKYLFGIEAKTNIVVVEGFKYKILSGYTKEPYVVAVLLGIAE